MAYELVALGECLIDFTPYGVSEAGQPLYERNPGGAPVNVAAAVAKLGRRSAFVGKVGSDPFGLYLKEMLQAHGVSPEGLLLTEEAHTTMAFVHLDEHGDRSFHFSRQPGADQLLRADEVKESVLEGAALFHFGSISMTAEPACGAVLHAVRKAKEAGALISYDPNWRPSLWRDRRQAKETILTGLAWADIVKVSEEELVFLMEDENLEAASARLLQQYPVSLLLVTAGAAGAYYRTEQYWGKTDSFPVAAVDTTGAGDGFLGALLYRVLESGKPLKQWSETELNEAVVFANAAGAWATTRKGAIPALAGLEDIDRLLSEVAGKKQSTGNSRVKEN
ncbi:fructokinase [Paenibacillus sp. UNCCL117]|uniref:carbohydrate kinase family protein n=1 Tax=unclassified Paenibacillus TaxID=185978 RepID=UPI0008920AB5|nr:MULTISPECIES: carbohydrate kinase [unclassified Paenibacillus]SDE19408.1 fructokinase [Paenibacillus sp. cl123]SFW62020.1 fructokinase [Paenibacillus sp. UNCCL117]